MSGVPPTHMLAGAARLHQTTPVPDPLARIADAAEVIAAAFHPTRTADTDRLHEQLLHAERRLAAVQRAIDEYRNTPFIQRSGYRAGWLASDIEKALSPLQPVI